MANKTTKREKMTPITINDLEINQDLDSKALKNIVGGRWKYTYETRYKYVKKSYNVRVGIWVNDRPGKTGGRRRR